MNKQHLIDLLAEKDLEIKRLNAGSRCPECCATEWNGAALARDERDDARTEVERLQGLVTKVIGLIEEMQADIPEDAGNATAHMIAKHLRTTLLKGAVAQPEPTDWRHFRWFDNHPVVPRKGSIHETRRNTTEAVCDECGEAIGLRSALTEVET